MIVSEGELHWVASNDWETGAVPELHPIASLSKSKHLWWDHPGPSLMGKQVSFSSELHECPLGWCFSQIPGMESIMQSWSTQRWLCLQGMQAEISQVVQLPWPGYAGLETCRHAPGAETVHPTPGPSSACSSSGLCLITWDAGSLLTFSTQTSLVMFLSCILHTCSVRIGFTMFSILKVTLYQDLPFFTKM